MVKRKDIIKKRLIQGITGTLAIAGGIVVIGHVSSTVKYKLQPATDELGKKAIVYDVEHFDEEEVLRRLEKQGSIAVQGKNLEKLLKEEYLDDDQILIEEYQGYNYYREALKYYMEKEKNNDGKLPLLFGYATPQIETYINRYLAKISEDQGIVITPKKMFDLINYKENQINNILTFEFSYQENETIYTLNVNNQTNHHDQLIISCTTDAIKYIKEFDMTVEDHQKYEIYKKSSYTALDPTNKESDINGYITIFTSENYVARDYDLVQGNFEDLEQNNFVRLTTGEDHIDAHCDSDTIQYIEAGLDQYALLNTVPGGIIENNRKTFNDLYGNSYLSNFLSLSKRHLPKTLENAYEEENNDAISHGL